MFSFAIIYDSDRRYLFPLELLEKFVDEATIDKIKTEILDQVQKL